MTEWIQAALAAATERWHTRTGLVIALGAVVVSLIVLFAGIDLANVNLLEWIVVLLAALAVCLLWFRTHIPRVPKGKIGFGVALEFEASPEARQLRADFVHTLRDLLQQSQFRHQSLFVEFPPGVTKQISNEENARSVAQRANVHFLLYGRARQRTLPQGPAHVMDLRGIVRHAPIPQNISKMFRDDFRAALPNRMIIGPQGDMLVCEFAARHIDAAARYVIGTAAALSGDFEYSEQLLLDAERRLTQFVKQAEGAPLSALLDRVQRRLKDVYNAWLSRLSQLYTLRRERAVLQSAEQVIANLRRYDPASYQARLVAAQCAFVLRRDLEQARSEINACSHMGDAVWLYGAAFLHAYDGDLQEAYRSYQKAFRLPLHDETVPTQCEEFIQIVIDEEPDRHWLYFCLGLINYRAKGDLEAAKRDFQAFLDRADTTRFPLQVAATTKWIEELNAMLASQSATSP